MSEKETMPSRLDKGAAEQRAASGLHVDIVPGTDVMRDVDDIHFNHGPKSHEVYVWSIRCHSRLPLSRSSLQVLTHT